MENEIQFNCNVDIAHSVLMNIFIPDVSVNLLYLMRIKRTTVLKRVVLKTEYSFGKTLIVRLFILYVKRLENTTIKI